RRLAMDRSALCARQGQAGDLRVRPDRALASQPDAALLAGARAGNPDGQGRRRAGTGGAMTRFPCGATVVAMLILGPPAVLAQPQAAPPAAPAVPADRPTIAVLNFANADPGNPRWDWLSKGLADLTIGDLASQGLHVVSREQMQEMIH